MKKFFVFLLSMIPVVASGANYLDIKIQDLTRIKQERIAELEKCQDVTGGLKIAGLTTLGISTIGIAANVAEAVVLKQKKDAVTELDKDIEKLNAEIRVYNKLQEGKKVNNGNDIRCGGDVNITNNTLNIGVENIANFSGLSFDKLLGDISPNINTTIVITIVDIVTPASP